MNYQVGDVVRFVEAGNASDGRQEIGKTAIVTFVDEDGYVTVDTDDKACGGWMDSIEFVSRPSQQGIGADRLRDEFAMAALTGLLAYSSNEGTGNYHNNSDAPGVAGAAYDYADAMMEARK